MRGSDPSFFRVVGPAIAPEKKQAAISPRVRGGGVSTPLPASYGGNDVKQQINKNVFRGPHGHGGLPSKRGLRVAFLW